MRASYRELDRAVLEAVSEDYQSFESIVSKLSLSDQGQCGATDIERTLLNSMANHLVGAYLIHADPPYATEVGANSDTIRRYWFCITEEGRRYLGHLPQKQAIARRRAPSPRTSQKSGSALPQKPGSV